MIRENLSDRILALQQVPMFRQLTREALEILASRTKRRRFSPGEHIVDEGEPGTTLFMVQAGLVKIVISTSDRSEVVLSLLSPNQIFGEMALLDGQPRSATAVAVEASDLVVLTRQEFLACLTIYPEVAIALLSELSSRLRRTNRLLSEIATHNLGLRLMHKLLELAESFGTEDEAGRVHIALRMRQQDLAVMVNASREQVNRSLRAMVAEGLITVEQQRITIEQPEALRARLRAVT